MPAASLLKYCYLAYFSKPKAERVLYRALRKARVASIVELGIGDSQRTKRLLEVAQRFLPGQTLRYTGIDLFEARPAEAAGLSLKGAHKRLVECDAKVQLVPGDPFSALARAANTLTKTDLLIVSADQDRSSLAKAWFYVPRMLQAGSLVYLEEPAENGQTAFRRLSVDEVTAFAAAANVRHSKRAA